MVGEEGRLSAFIDSHYLKKGEGVSSENACSKARNVVSEFIAESSVGLSKGHSSGKERSGNINACIIVYS